MALQSRVTVSAHFVLLQHGTSLGNSQTEAYGLWRLGMQDGGLSHCMDEGLLSASSFGRGKNCARRAQLAFMTNQLSRQITLSHCHGKHSLEVSASSDVRPPKAVAIAPRLRVQQGHFGEHIPSSAVPLPITSFTSCSCELRIYSVVCHWDSGFYFRKISVILNNDQSCKVQLFLKA